jgi:hypothetical protein
MLTNTYNALNRMVGEIGEWKKSIANNDMGIEELNNMVETIQNFTGWVLGAYERDKTRPLSDIRDDIYRELEEDLGLSDLCSIYEEYTTWDTVRDIDDAFDSPSDLLDAVLSNGYDARDYSDADVFVKADFDFVPYTEDEFADVFYTSTLSNIFADGEYELLMDISDRIDELVEEYKDAKEKSAK